MEWLSHLWPVIPAAAIVSALTTFFIRWLDRPRAVLTVEHRMTNGAVLDAMNTDNVSYQFMAMTNRGDGAAYEVELYGHLVDVCVEQRSDTNWHPSTFVDRLSSIAPGETVEIRGCLEVATPGDPAMVVRWTHHPGRMSIRGLRRFRTFKLKDMPASSSLPAGLHGIGELPKRFRRWRDLHSITPRGRWDEPEPDSL